MSAVLYLLAFPGLPWILFLRFRRSMRDYLRHVAGSTTYREPSVDDVLERGFLGTYRTMAQVESAMNEEVRLGRHGDRA